MASAHGFRVILLMLVTVVGGYGVASTIAEATSVERPEFAQGAGPARAAPEWLTMVRPFRSDLESNHALAAALSAAQRGESNVGGRADNQAERSRLIRSLAVAPIDAGLWLALAQLEFQHDPTGPDGIEALKMAYFTGPNEQQLMAARLDTATRFDALADPDMAEFARGDVRLMLTRAPQKAALKAAFRRASDRGKAFLSEAIRAIDPAFLATLRG